MKSKQWVILIITIFSVLSFLSILLNYIVDPFQQYRISSWYEITSKKQREVIPGLAKNMPVETVLIGSSMSENFKASFIDRELETSSLKLCAAGITAYEMNMLLRTIINNNSHVNNIIIVLDLYALSGKPDRIRNTAFPSYLYDSNPVNDVFYLLNQDTLRYSYKMIKDSRGKKTDFDNMWYWGDRYAFSRKSVLSSYEKYGFNTSFKNEDYKSDILIVSFTKNILSVIKDNEHIRFTIVYPPYSFLTYRDMREKSWLEDAFKAKYYIASLDLGNLAVYDFQCATSITEDLDNYKDISHYSPAINRFMITAIKNKEYLVDETNLSDCIDTTRKTSTVRP